ncbi:hypothetical protein FA13DRAFT_199535 [Coprinellus micaceus]|uniref:Uncharacterized protein n=1 Tax=Coprinellus micaceus TaxID=71717 RepID=A0A4Y7TH65_COPMI|nr:hypothetical protein FA13DRAFT_199535 [Coprinellus micaceus]
MIHDRCTKRMSPQWEIAQAAIDKELYQLRADLEEQISRLNAAFEEEKLLLSHELNLLAPINRLPPEILSKVFLGSLDIRQVRYPSLLNPPPRTPKLDKSPTSQQLQEQEKSDPLTLCHVSQYWRTLVLNNP